MERIASFEPRPPRQYDDDIAREMERVRLKAMAKRASERYSTAKDLADDLRHFLAGASAAEKSSLLHSAAPAVGQAVTPTLS